jgi:hypothetical protein
MALGMWLGAVCATWMLCRRAPELRSLWRSVSSLAAVGTLVTGVSGLLLSGRVVMTVTALLGTSYGQRIVLKGVLLVVLGVLGAMAASRALRGAEPQRLAIELTIAAVAVIVAATLVGSAPARGERFTAPLVPVPQVVTSDLRDLTVSASVEPASPGPNLVQVRVLDTRRPSPGPIQRVTVRVTAADGAPVVERDGELAGGVVEWADVSLPNPGTYRVEIDVSRPASPVAPLVASWAVGRAPVPRARPVVSTRSWAALAALLAAAWAAMVAVAWFSLRRRGRPVRLNRVATETG